MSGLVLIDGLVVAPDGSGGSPVPPGQFAHLDLLDERDYAVRYFSPMAERLVAPCRGAAPLVLPMWDPGRLGPPARRSLERTALTLMELPAAGGVPDPFQATSLAGTPAEAPLRPISTVPARFSGDSPGWVPQPYGAGAFRPGSVLVVGERSQVALRGQLKHRLPFVTFAGEGASWVLAMSLEHYGVPEASLYWINAFDGNLEPEDGEVVEKLNPRRVVTLGPLAELWVRRRAPRMDYGVSEVDAPRFWKGRQGPSPDPRKYPLGKIIARALGHEPT